MREIHIFNYAFTSLILVLFSLGIRMMERHATNRTVPGETGKGETEFGTGVSEEPDKSSFFLSIH